MIRQGHRLYTVLASGLLVIGCARPEYRTLLLGGTIYDGSGGPGYVADLAILGDSIVRIGSLAGASARRVIDARGLAVAPGFVNMLSWANVSLIHDGRSQGDIRQGVTLEVMGEGNSMGPLTETVRQEMLANQGDIKYPISWSTLRGYLDWLTRRRISTNVASFVGATTVRLNVLGHEPREATPDELTRMAALVRQAMQEGALGVSSSLIYEPAFHATTDELVALARAAHEYGGMYISHIRGEGDSLLPAIDELIEISRRSGAPAEIYHLKASGPANWARFDSAVARVEAARREGLRITADMYTYPASATGLDASLPHWVRNGGIDSLVVRLGDPAVRQRVLAEMNGFAGTGGAGGVLLVGFRQDSLRPLIGKTLKEVAAARQQPPEETAMDLIRHDHSRVGVFYFSMSEDNVRKGVALPWMSFGSDAGSMATEGIFLRSGTHPRAYGNFARLLGRYVREEKLIPLEEAIRRLTSLPAENLGLKRRGRLRAGYYADVVVFDPATIQDHATFEQPHQYATGVRYVFVNGTLVLANGVHTGATPGRVVTPGR